jgi:hypothetical protein
VLHVTVWSHRAPCDCVGHKKPTVNEQPGACHQQKALHDRVFGPLYVAESIRLHNVDMLELYAVPQMQEQDWSPLLFSSRVSGVGPLRNEIATTS